MTTVDHNQLSTLLHGATADLEPRAGFTDAVVRGGRRRQMWHRIVVATSTAVVVALVTGGAYALLGDITQVETTTGGDLAGDQEFLKSALQAWEAGKRVSPNAGAGVFDDLRGEPTVHWAGTTPAGRAAVVTQPAFLHPHERLPDSAANTTQTLVGLVATDPTDGKFKLVTDQFRVMPDDPDPGYFQFGPGNRTLLVVERDQPLFETHYAIQLPAPPLSREERMELFNPMPFKDGVAILQLDNDDFAQTTAVFEGPDPLVDNPVQLPIVVASDYVEAVRLGVAGPLDRYAEESLAWPGVDVGYAHGPVLDIPTTFGLAVLAKFSEGKAGSWHIRAGLADGRIAIVGEFEQGRPSSLPGRIYAALVDENGNLSPQLVEGGPVDRYGPLPVKLRLPDQQGWVIANNGKELKYRTTVDGSWQDAGANAALVPDETVQVLVDGEVVDLPR